MAVGSLSKSFESRRRGGGSVVALDGVDLAASEGELLVVVGPSGSGKTTLLRCVAGLEEPDHGRVEVGGSDVTGTRPGDRDLAMVFQDYALYPHISVEGNISFGLRARKETATEVRKRVREAAEMLSLEGLLERRPDELSGGERQRVALARAIVRHPRAFLMDEPLSNLDAELRMQTRADIRVLQRRLETTMLYVTHDQVEAKTMGESVALLRPGRLEQVGNPENLYDHPANAFVARFIGSPPMNLFPATLHGGPSGDRLLGVRPERLRVVSLRDGRLRGRVQVFESLGADAIVSIDVAGHPFLARTTREASIPPGTEVGLAFSDLDLYEFEGPDGRALR
ncbi:MAG: ABC transporter ATP-binding protein [Actinomycetota bacterium]